MILYLCLVLYLRVSDRTSEKCSNTTYINNFTVGIHCVSYISDGF